MMKRAAVGRLASTILLLPAAILSPSAPALAAGCADPASCSCTVSSSGLVFGTYSQQTSTPSDSVGTISVRCDSSDPGNSSFTIALSPGGSSNAAQRSMGGGAERLLYNLYTNVTRSTIWGDDSGGGVSVTVPFSAANGATQAISVYGRIPARQNIPPGYYGDVITVTVTY